ncbi:MAG: Bug family tripartite tricarboxylate transporter substrate binding protein [Lautropia sp.]
MIRFALALALALPAALAVPIAAAQSYPTGTVRLVVPYPPGGGVDGLARPLAERLGVLWGKPVIVENRAGAATIIGTDFVAKAAPDGHTLLFTSDSSITSNPHLYAKLPFDPMKDLVPVTQLIDLYQMVVVHPSVKADSMKALVALAKASPTPLNYGSYGAGSQPHLLFETLKLETGIDLTHVPYKGIAPALTATLANEVQMTLGGAATTGGHLSTGRMKALAIAAPRRNPQWPDVPTLREAGYPEVGPRSWFGILAPRGTPDATVERIARDVASIMADPAFDATQVTGKGYQRVASTPAEFAAAIREDHAQKGRMISQSKIRVE